MHDYIHSMRSSDLRFIHTTKKELHWSADQFVVAHGLSFALKKMYVMPL